MSDRDRSWLFAVAALALIAAAAVIARALDGPAAAAPGVRDGSTPRRTILVPAHARKKGQPDGKRGAPRRRWPATEDLPPGVRPGPASRVDPEARRAAGRFVRALLRVETGASDLGWRTAIRQNGIRTLARRVLGASARVPLAGRFPDRGSLVALQPLREPDGGVAFVATIARAGRRTGLVLDMTARGDRWRVGGLR